ncbi:MAG: DUF3857 domain-containing protein, partial [Rariglobus sp.]
MRFVFLFLALLSSGAFAASVTLAPPNAWVQPTAEIAFTETPAANASYGYDYFLIDRQVNVAEAEGYDRYVYRITSESTLGSGARMTWSFDPSYETLTLHHVRVIRDGVVQERLRDGLVQIIQQERDLDRHMLNGRHTALVLLADVRVGDVIDYAASLRGANPVFNGNYMDSFSTGWAVPIRHQRLRVVAPKDRPLMHKHQGDSALTFSTKSTDDHVTYTWEGRDLPVITSEDEVPSWFTAYPFVQLTEFKTWAAVTRWAVPLYAGPEIIPEAVTKQAAELIRGATNDEERTIALLKFVQQEIRYLGLELGPGTHRPTPPDEVLSRRFGDCKDKTLLFCTLMRAVGLEAYPALVNTSDRHRIAEWVPSPYAFDHVIACVPRGESSWWVDPTLSYQQGGALRRGIPDYRLALIVRDGTESLTPVTRAPLSLRRIEIDEQFDVTGFDTPTRFKVTTRYTGLSAENIRSRLSRTSLDEITKDYVNYYTSSYPGITSTQPVSWKDDAETNTVVVEENYTVPSLWKAQKEPHILKAEFYPQPISDYATQPSTRVRTMPLATAHPLNVRLTTRVNLHEDWPVKPSETVIVDHAFRASDKISGSGRLVQMDYTWESLADYVPADKITDHVAAIDRLRNRLGYHLTFDKKIAAAEAEPEKPGHFRFNWMPVVLTLITGAAVFYVGRRLIGRRPLTPPSLPGPGEDRLVGLGGWLVVVAFGLILRPIIICAQLFQEFSYVFDLDRWEAITTPGVEGYQATLGPLVSIAFVGNVILVTGGILLVVLFF